MNDAYKGDGVRSTYRHCTVSYCGPAIGPDVRGRPGVITRQTAVLVAYSNVKVEGPFKTDDYKY